jgi:hypothetical protein
LSPGWHRRSTAAAKSATLRWTMVRAGEGKAVLPGCAGSERGGAGQGGPSLYYTRVVLWQEEERWSEEVSFRQARRPRRLEASRRLAASRGVTRDRPEIHGHSHAHSNSRLTISMPARPPRSMSYRGSSLQKSLIRLERPGVAQVLIMRIRAQPE